MTGMRIREASDVPMFYFLTWMNSLLKYTFTCYIVICVVVVFHEKSRHPPQIIQINPQIAQIHN